MASDRLLVAVLLRKQELDPDRCRIVSVTASVDERVSKLDTVRVGVPVDFDQLAVDEAVVLFDPPIVIDPKLFECVLRVFVVSNDRVQPVFDNVFELSDVVGEALLRVNVLAVEAECVAEIGAECEIDAGTECVKEDAPFDFVLSLVALCESVRVLPLPVAESERVAGMDCVNDDIPFDFVISPLRLGLAVFDRDGGSIRSRVDDVVPRFPVCL